MSFDLKRVLLFRFCPLKFRRSPFLILFCERLCVRPWETQTQVSRGIFCHFSIVSIRELGRRSLFGVENLHIDIAELLAFFEETRFKCFVTFDKMVRHYEQLSLKQLLKQLQKQRSFKAVFTFIGTYKYQTVKIVLHTKFELGCDQFLTE